MTDPILSAENIVFGHSPGVVIIDRLTLTLPAFKMTALVGPNGCGKSTLLSLLAGVETPRSGTVRLRGGDIQTIRSRERASVLGFLPQTPEVSSGVLVSELLELGRVPHRPFFEPWRADDQRALEDAARATGVRQFLDTPVDALSGGQRQRAFIAMTLTQTPQILLLDEPTSSLDIAQQISILALLRQRVHDTGLTVVVAIHDIAQAAQFADHIVVMKSGGVVGQGAPEEVVTPTLFEDVFDVSVNILTDTETGHIAIVPKRVGK
ncbi:MAG: ABC transporter ATP-binding protein [Pseudomonadota bacterium]